MADPPPLTEGERWSRELLAQLRARRYRPDAWADFLRRSFERAEAVRGARPELARQARCWGVAGAAANLVLARVQRLPAHRGLAWWGMCWAMLDWHLGMVESPRGERRRLLCTADALTLARLALVPYAATPAGRAWWTAVVAIAAASDAADGRHARRRGPTRLGAQLDSSADALFFSAAAVGAARAGWTPRPVALAALVRHLGGAGLVAWHWFARGAPPHATGTTRWAAAPSAAGLLLGAAGARRTGAILLATSSAAAAATPFIDR